MIPVILAGGSGSRLWPLSRQAYPKQLLSLCGDKTLLQLTVERAIRIADQGTLIVVTNEALRFLVRDQLASYQRKINIDIIVEPLSLNTAPAIALAAWYVFLTHGEETPLCIMPADHMIFDVDRFCEAITSITPSLEENHLVTFGITPTYPETGYGYIQRVDGVRADGCYAVKAFVEKPTREKADTYFNSGNYYWNAGIFAFRASVFLAELQQYQDKMYHCTRVAIDKAARDVVFQFVSPERASLLNCPADSIDYALMEHSQRIIVKPLSVGWSDIGSWEALYQFDRKDEQNNVLKGDVLVNDVVDSYIHADSRLVVCSGLKNVVIIETSDAVFAMDKSQGGAIKGIIDTLKKQGRNEIVEKTRVHRPWGYYETLIESPGFKVKRVTVKPGERLSLQSHQHRSEHWVVVKGVAEVQVGDAVRVLHENESTYISKTEKHRLTNPGVELLELIEVQVGKYVGEDDIQRYEDVYGRSMDTGRSTQSNFLFMECRIP